MPVFVLKGKDALALATIAAYRQECFDSRLFEQAQQVNLAYREMASWQNRHRDLIKLPDHKHVPVGETRQ
jgi:hypothetical protein